MYLNKSQNDSPYRYFSIKTSGSEFKETISEIKEVFNKHFSRTSFDFFVFNDNIRTNYAEDYLLRTILMIFTSIAIILSCLGLFALTSLLLARRTKEIGIRKVLGASLKDIFKKIYKELLVPAHIKCSGCNTSYLVFSKRMAQQLCGKDRFVMGLFSYTNHWINYPDYRAVICPDQESS